MLVKEKHGLNTDFIRNLGTEPLPAKAGRFGVLLKQPKVVSALCYSFYL